MTTTIVLRFLLITLVLSHTPSPVPLRLDSSIPTETRQSSNAIISLGGFTNMKHDQEHAYGYSLQLWREQNRLFGFFLSSQGLIGDTPTGLLENVKFNSQTGELMFNARLTTGLFSNRQFSFVPSRYVYQFKGFVKRDRITGTLVVVNAFTPEEAPRRERITLKKSKRESEMMIEAQTYDDWKSQADEILKFRGPKW